MQILIQNHLSLKISLLLKEEKGKLCFESLKNELTYKNPKYISAITYGYSVFKIEKHIRMYYILGDEIFIFRGCLNQVKRHFQKFKINVNFVDYTQTHQAVSIIKKPKFELMPSQKENYDKFLKLIDSGTTQGIFIADTSFGKSYFLLHIANYIRQPIVILCHTTFVQKQWVNDELVTNCGIKKEDIGGAGGMFSKPVVKNINVALYHSMSKKHINALFKNKIGLLIIDEVHKASVQQMQDAINSFRAKFRFGGSASIDRKDGLRFLVEALVGDVVLVAKKTESDSKINCRIFKTETGWSPLEGGNHVAVISEASKDKERNLRISRSAIRKVKENKIVIVFVERKEQAAVLAKFLSKFRVHLLIGALTKEEIFNLDISDKAKDFLLNNDPEQALNVVKELALKRQLDIVIATQKAEVGLSIETLDHCIVTTPVGNNIERFHQLKGRVERKHKEQRLELFGEKEIPTLEVMVDKEDSSLKAWDLIELTYKRFIIKNPFKKQEK